MENVVKKTGYEWSLEANIRLLNLRQYGVNEGEYFIHKVSAAEFYERLSKCTVKPNSQPRKTPMYLEYRMYGLVAYQLSGTIHAGIQFGHAVVDYARTVRDIKSHEALYNKWADEDKTFIILNGGTTNNNPERLGSLNVHLNTMREAGVLVKEFHEPDLGDQLTAFVFLVDERVFDRTIYPDFIPETLPYSKKKPSEKQLSELDARNKKNYEHWVEKIGGPTNAFLRDYLRPLRLV